MKIWRYDIWLPNKENEPLTFGKIVESEMPDELVKKFNWDRGNRIDIPVDNHVVFITDSEEKMNFLSAGLGEMFYLLRDGILNQESPNVSII